MEAAEPHQNPEVPSRNHQINNKVLHGCCMLAIALDYIRWPCCSTSSLLPSYWFVSSHFQDYSMPKSLLGLDR